MQPKVVTHDIDLLCLTGCKFDQNDILWTVLRFFNCQMIVVIVYIYHVIFVPHGLLKLNCKINFAFLILDSLYIN